MYSKYLFNSHQVVSTGAVSLKFGAFNALQSFRSMTSIVFEDDLATSIFLL